MKFYRFRSTKRLIESELESQTIYFAHPSELNDPMEGLREVTWKGDRIAWENLFRHYTFCLLTCYIGGAFEEPDFNAKDIPIAGSEEDLPNETSKELFKKVHANISNSGVIGILTSKLSRRKKPISKDELWIYLDIMIGLIISSLRVSTTNSSKIDETHSPQEHIQKVNEILVQYALIAEGQNAIDNFNAILFKGKQHRLSHNLMNILKLNRKIFAENLLGFPDKYLDALERLCYQDWYTACFMSDYQNSSVWGHYAQDHSGACLIFESRNDGENSFLDLEMNRFIGHDYKKEEKPLKFCKIRYTKKPTTVEFFSSIGTITISRMNRIWYSDNSGNFSTVGRKKIKGAEKWRENYWKKFHNSITQKSTDWRYEKEYRLIITSFDATIDKKNRILKYKFESLKGIIFGIKTPISEKLKIINIIQGKCKMHGVQDFDFFQAYYDTKTGKIQHEKLTIEIKKQ